MTGSLLLALLGVALLVDVIIGHFRAARSIKHARKEIPRAASYPSITVVRPIRGRDVDAELNFTASLNTGYPGEVETLFVLDEASDPGYPVAVDVVKAHEKAGRPGTARVLVAGPPPPGRTGKLNAMILGMSCAKGELVAFGDSDTRPDQDVLRVAVDTLLNAPGAGASFAPVVAQGQFAAAGDAGYASMINAWYGPSVAAASEKTGDMPFIMGQLMVFKRDAIKAMGGLEDAEGQLVDDMYIGMRVAQVGYRNVVSPHPLRIAMGGMSLAGFVPTLRRWIIFSKSGLPAPFTAPMWRRGIQFFLALIGTVVAVGSGRFAVAALPGLALVTYGASMLQLYKDFSGEWLPWKYAYVPWLVPIIGQIAFVTSFTHKKVEWRGRSYGLKADGQLSNGRPASAPGPVPAVDSTQNNASGVGAFPAGMNQ